ncbi:MAG: L-type lectin-domain containing protein, partial [Bradymonadaceae bacterium]
MMVARRILSWLLFGLVVALPSVAVGITYDFSNFSSVADLTLNGDAAQTNKLVRLTPDANQKKGSAFFSCVHDFDGDTSFQTHFVVRIHGTDSTGADGMTFTLHSSAAGETALGGLGGGLGYDGIESSVAVELDTHANGSENDNHTGVLTDGSTSGTAMASPSFDFNDGKETHV